MILLKNLAIYIMRKIILSILGILLVLAAILISNQVIENKEVPKQSFNKIVKTVFVEEVLNKDIPIVINASGNLMAKNKIEIYSEVQGVFNGSDRNFKAGTRFEENDVMLRINQEEFYASLQSQKSNFFNLITAVIPDLRLDYPNDFSKWESYVQKFDFNKPTPELPQFSSDKEKYFISGKGIVTSYYNLRNLEVKLKKHQIKAPFDGVLTEALVSPGTLVRVGQKLGEFIDPSVFEMEVAINASYASLLEVNSPVELHSLDKLQQYSGKIIRINGKVDLTSQTIQVYVQVADKNLKEGMFLEADLVTKSESNVIELSRKLVVNNSAVYTVEKDSILTLKKIQPVFFNSETVVIRGLKNKEIIVTQIPPGAYDGMIVKMNKTN